MENWKDNPNEFAIEVIQSLWKEGEYQIDAFGGDYDEWQAECDELIAEVKATEVAPVVHAHWIADSKDCKYTCSHCGDVWKGDFDLDPYDDHFYYCPCCGAKMDEEVE